MSKRPRKRANRARKPSTPPRRPSGARVLAEHLEGELEWDELLHGIEDYRGLAAEIVRAIQTRRAAGTLEVSEAEGLIDRVVEHEAYCVMEPGAVMKALTTRIQAIEREHGLSDDEHWLRHEGPPEWRMLNRAWEAYMDAAAIRILEALDEPALARDVADRWPYEDGYTHPFDESMLDELLERDDDSFDVDAVSPGESISNDSSSGTTASGETPIRVIAAVIARGDELLVCQRPAHKRHGGLWEFPGGKVEPDESDEDSARRELAEELGVRVVRAGAAELEVRDEGSAFLIAFVPVEIEGEPECREHSELRWGTAEALRELPLAPSDRRYVEELLTRRDAAR
jgi:mutator protein MutT